MSFLNQFNLESLKEAGVSFRRLSRAAKIRLAVILGGSFLFFIFFVWPAWIERPHLQGQVKSLRSSLVLAESKIKLEPNLVKEKEQYDAFIHETESRFLTEGEAQSLLGVLTEMADKSGVKLLSTQPQTDVPIIPDPFKDKYVPLTYLLAVEGGFHGLAAFISNVENYAKILRVEEFSAVPKEENPGALVGEVRLTAYLLKDEIKKVGQINAK